MRYWLHPEAREDLREAAEFYRERAGSALAMSLLEDFERAATLLLQHPRLGSIWRHRRRRWPLTRFPYSLIYTVSGDEIRILAVAHHSRRPGYWRGRR
jgi:plasmid stabilization system protein ParE